MSGEKSLFQESWSYVWKRKPLDLVRNIINALRDRPVACYVSAICFFHWHWMSPFIIFFGFVLNQMLIELFSKSRVFFTQIKIVNGYLNVYEQYLSTGLQADKYLVSDYLTWQYEDIDTWFLKKFTGLMGIDAFSINDIVNVYCIRSSHAISGNLTCYSAPPLSAYVFFNEPPSDHMGPFQKFSLLHELGHACLVFLSGTAYSAHCIKLYLAYFIFMLALLNWRTLPVWCYICIGLVLLFALVEKLLIWSTKKLKDEIFADDFAIGYLDEDDVQGLSVLLNKYAGIFVDRELNEMDNRVRLKLLAKNIELMKDGKEDERIEATFGSIYKPSFLLLIFTCVSVALPAIYSKPPSISLLIWTGVAMLVSVILFVFEHLVIDAMHRIIKQRLDGWKEKSGVTAPGFG